jgi:hypothetical protein
MNQKLSLSFVWASIFSLASLLWISIAKPLGLLSTHLDKFPIYSMLFFVPAFLIWYWALKAIKTKAFNNSINFKEAFIVGLIITIIATAFVPVVQLIFHKLVEPNYFNIMIEQAKSKGGSSAEEAEAIFNLKSYMIQSVIASLLAGVFTSAIIALIVKNKKAN